MALLLPQPRIVRMKRPIGARGRVIMPRAMERFRAMQQPPSHPQTKAARVATPKRGRAVPQPPAAKAMRGRESPYNHPRVADSQP